MKKKNILMCAVVLFTILRILLMAQLPIWAIGDAGGDDMLLVRYADSIVKGTWIMEGYSSSTLVKGISYPIFLAFCQCLGLPYFIGLAILYVFSAGIFCKAISPVVAEKGALCGLYVFLLYSPAGFDSDVTQRVYRMAIIVPQVTIVFACFFGMWFRKNQDIKKQIPWAIGAGSSLAFFWYIREDSIWMLPFIITGTALLIIHAFMYYRRQIVKRILIFVLPMCILLVSSVGYSVMNYIHYDTFLINDRTQGAFAELCGNLLKIDPGIEENVPTAWVYREALDSFAELSPDFKELRDKMYTYETWFLNGEFKGDLYQWAVRKAASDLGYYRNSDQAEQFFRQLNDELKQAFEDGRLAKKEALYLSSQSKGIELKEIPELLEDAFKNTISLLSYEYLEMDVYREASGNDRQIRLMETITNSLAVYPSTYEYRVRGTLQTKNDSDVLELYLVDNETQEEITPIEIKYGTFFANHQTAEKKEYSINVYVNGVLESNLAAEDVVDNSVYSYEAYGRIVENVDYTVEYARNTEEISNHIVGIYRKTAVPVAVLAGIFFLVFAGVTFKELRMKKYELWNSFIPVLGLFATCLVLILGNTLFTGWLTALDGRNSRFVFYAIGAVPMIQIFEFMCLYFGVKQIVELARKRR